MFLKMENFLGHLKIYEVLRNSSGKKKLVRLIGTLREGEFQEIKNSSPIEAPRQAKKCSTTETKIIQRSLSMHS